MFGHQLESGDLVAAIKGCYAEIGVIKPVKGKVHYYRIVLGDSTLHPWASSTQIASGDKPYIDYVSPESKRVIKLDPSILNDDQKKQYDIIYKFIKGI